MLIPDFILRAAGFKVAVTNVNALLVVYKMGILGCTVNQIGVPLPYVGGEVHISRNRGKVRRIGVHQPPGGVDFANKDFTQCVHAGSAGGAHPEGGAQLAMVGGIVFQEAKLHAGAAVYNQNDLFKGRIHSTQVFQQSGLVVVQLQIVLGFVAAPIGFHRGNRQVIALAANAGDDHQGGIRIAACAGRCTAAGVGGLG